VFSLSPDGREHLVPSSVTQRYGRPAKRLEIDAHLHNPRRYSATELIAAGVDVRTVAGRLGHSGGGSHDAAGLRGVVGRGRPARLDVEWKATAAIYADPVLVEELGRSLDGDFGPVPAPEGS